MTVVGKLIFILLHNEITSGWMVISYKKGSGGYISNKGDISVSTQKRAVQSSQEQCRAVLAKERISYQKEERIRGQDVAQFTM